MLRGALVEQALLLASANGLIICVCTHSFHAYAGGTPKVSMSCCVAERVQACCAMSSHRSRMRFALSHHSLGRACCGDDLKIHGKLSRTSSIFKSWKYDFLFKMHLVDFSIFGTPANITAPSHTIKHWSKGKGNLFLEPSLIILPPSTNRKNMCVSLTP